MKLSLAWIAGGLILGAIVHIFSIFWVPVVAENDAWTRLTAFGPVNRLNLVPADAVQGSALPDLDPSVHHAVCRYNLETGPLRIVAPIPPVYWSLALYDRRGVNYYALNDRIVGGRSIQLWLATQEQLLSLEAESEPGEEPDARLVIGAPGLEGFALFRALASEPSVEAMIKQAFQKTECAIVDAQTARRQIEEEPTGSAGRSADKSRGGNDGNR